MVFAGRKLEFYPTGNLIPIGQPDFRCDMAALKRALEEMRALNWELSRATWDSVPDSHGALGRFYRRKPNKITALCILVSWSASKSADPEDHQQSDLEFAETREELASLVASFKRLLKACLHILQLQILTQTLIATAIRTFLSGEFLPVLRLREWLTRHGPRPPDFSLRAKGLASALSEWRVPIPLTA
jgi:hypothetical protein